MGYDNTLCSLAGRPHTPRQREIRDHPPISEAELIKKRDIVDPLEDDDDIDSKHNPFDVDSSTMKGNHRSNLCLRLP
jgi:hypothetical protein